MDPLNKHHAGNFDIKPHEGDDTGIRHNFVHQKLVALINYIKNALRSIAYAISPKSNPAYISYMRGEDIAMVMPTDCGNEAVNQEMLKFSDNVRKFWESNTPQEVVDFFVKSGVKNVYNMEGAFKWAHLIEDGVIPDITQDELVAFSKAHDMMTHPDRASKLKKYESLDVMITFREIKNFYNAFVKYMNYAIKNDPENATKVADLEKLFFGDVDIIKGLKRGNVLEFSNEQVDEALEKSKVLDSDRNILKSDNDFIMLLQSLKEYAPTHKVYKSGHEGNTFYNLVGNILGDNKDHSMNYTDLKRLKRSADIIENIISKKHNEELTQTEYYCDMLYEASRLGLAPWSLGSDLEKEKYFKARDGEKISEKDFEEILLNNGFGEKASGLITAMESFPDIVNKTLASIDLDTQLKHAIKLNVLNQNY